MEHGRGGAQNESATLRSSSRPSENARSMVSVALPPKSDEYPVPDHRSASTPGSEEASGRLGEFW